jgi:hypothetical protein
MAQQWIRTPAAKRVGAVLLASLIPGGFVALAVWFAVMHRPGRAPIATPHTAA